MNYYYLVEHKKDQVGFRSSVDSVIRSVGKEKFSRMYYKTKMTHIELDYLAALLVTIYLELTPSQVDHLCRESKKGKGILAKYYKAHRDEQDS